MKRKYSLISKSDPYSQSYTPYKKRMKFSPGYGPSAFTKASSALRMIRKLKKEEEVKNVDKSGTISIPTATTGTWPLAQAVALNTVGVGNTSTTRLGNKVTMKNLLIRGFVYRPSTDLLGAFYRVIVLYDRSPNGAMPAILDVFNTDSILAPLGKKKPGRFAILKEFEVNLDSVTHFIPFKFYLDLARVNKASYGIDQAGNITDMDKGSLVLWVSGEGLDVAASTLYYNSRVTYTDA